MEDLQKYPVIDCRSYQGNNSPYSAGRTISRQTAIHALKAIKDQVDRGAYKMMYADDQGSLADAIKELEEAVAILPTEHTVIDISGPIKFEIHTGICYAIHQTKMTLDEARALRLFEDEA